MAETYFPFDGGAGANVTESNWQDMAQLWATNGVKYGDNNQLNLTAGTGLQTVLNTGAAWINGFFYRNTSTKNLNHAANGSSNPRIDSIVLTLDTAANTVAGAIVQGTAASSPVPPSLTSNQLLIGNVAIVGNATTGTTLTSGNFTMQRQWVGAASTLYSWTPTWSVYNGTGSVAPQSGAINNANFAYFNFMPGGLVYFSISRLMTITGTVLIFGATLPLSPALYQGASCYDYNEMASVDPVLNGVYFQHTVTSGGLPNPFQADATGIYLPALS